MLPASRARPSPAARLGARAARPAEGTCSCQHRFLLPANRAAPTPGPGRCHLRLPARFPRLRRRPGGVGAVPRTSCGYRSIPPPAAVGSFNAASYDGVSLLSEQPHLQERSLPYPIPLSLHHHSPSLSPPPSHLHSVPQEHSPKAASFVPKARGQRGRWWTVLNKGGAGKEIACVTTGKGKENQQQHCHVTHSLGCIFRCLAREPSSTAVCLRQGNQGRAG